MEKQSLWRIIKKYHWESAFIKNCLLWFLAMLIPTYLIGAILILVVNNIHNEKMAEANNYYHKNACRYFESLLISLDSYCSLISNNSATADYIFETIPDKNELHGTILSITSNLTAFINSSTVIDSIYLYNAYNDYVLSNISSGHIDTFFDTDWYKPYKQERINFTLARQIALNNNVISYLTFSRKIYINSFEVGILVFNVNADKLKHLLLQADNNVDIKIMDRNNRIIFSNDFQQALLSEYNGKEINNKNNNTFISSSIQNQFTLTTDFNGSHSIKSQKIYVYIYICLFLLLLFSGILISYRLSLNYFRLIVENILQFQNSYSKDSISPKSLTELDLIIKSPLLYKGKNNAEQFLISQYTKLRRLQLASLQEQINPHFVFNTLHLIGLLDADMHGSPTKISEITALLSGLLHFSIDTTTNLIGIGEEIENLEKYIKLQNIKYEDKFHYIKTVDEDILDCAVLKFMLQPIVENAIIHGILKTKSRTGILTLNAHKREANIIIEISNTGNTIPEERLTAIKHQLSTNQEPAEKHIGLLNVNNRIKILCGEQYGCDIFSHQEKTTVRYILPFIKDSK